jgi:histidyl-tRNA synthetase
MVLVVGASASCQCLFQGSHGWVFHRVFKQCDTLKAKRLILLGTTEWEQGKVSVKDLSVREQTLKTVDELIPIL